jgi:multisubunit Na+/H+ antiporter MnhC subunit
VSAVLAYGLAGAALITIGLYGLIVRRHLLRKILAMNVVGNGVFLVLVALAKRSAVPDPVPHALAVRVRDATGQATLDERRGTAAEAGRGRDAPG